MYESIFMTVHTQHGWNTVHSVSDPSCEHFPSGLLLLQQSRGLFIYPPLGGNLVLPKCQLCPPALHAEASAWQQTRNQLIACWCFQRGLWASLELAQVVVEGLHVGEDAHGVWLTAHDHHIVHLDQPVAACLHSGGGDKGRQVEKREG